LQGRPAYDIETKEEAPMSKHQVPSNFQFPKFEISDKLIGQFKYFLFWPFGLGAWNLFGIWDLEFGILISA
jgi:hypothetical protein